MTDRDSNVWLRILGTRASVSALAAINPTILKTGATVFVTSLGTYYTYIAESTEAPNGSTIVAPLSGDGRWFATSQAYQPAWELVADWYVDEQNVTGNASDANVGDSPTAPLATVTAWSQRLSGLTVQQTTTLHVISNAQNVPVIPAVRPGTQVNVIGEAPTVLLPESTIDAVVNMASATNTRASIQIAGVDWAAQGLINKRARVTSGPRAGTMFWIEAVGGSPDIALTSRPANLFSLVTLQVGDPIVVEELTTIGPPRSFQQVSEPFLLTEITGLRVVPPAGLTNPIVNFASQAQFVGCDLEIFRFEGEIIMTESRLDCVFVLPNYAGMFAYSCSLTPDRIRGPGPFNLNGNSTFPNDSIFIEQGANLIFNDPVGCWEWGGAALDVGAGCFADLTSDRLFGTSAVAGSFGVRVRANGKVTYTTVPTAAGALGTDINIGGATALYAALPAAGADPAGNNAWMVVAA